uniref:Uncharacterized protein n=1 Tax=Mesocestoides corti TaxID=53468 RepID=A0A5K3ETW8_MESCO
MNDESFLQVYKTKVPRQLFARATILPDVGYGKCRTGYFTNTGYQQQCGEPSQKLRTASLLWGRHARRISSQPEKDTTEEQFIMSGIASVEDLDGRRLTRGSSLWLVNKVCFFVPVLFLLVPVCSKLAALDRSKEPILL